MDPREVSQTHVKRPKNIFMQEIFLMQQQNIWLELKTNRFMMLARLVRFNRDLVSGWWLLLKTASREIWSVVGWLLLNKKETWSVVGWLVVTKKQRLGQWLVVVTKHCQRHNGPEG